MKKITDIFQHFQQTLTDLTSENSVTELTTDSRLVNSNSVFIALTGENSSGLNYLSQVEKLGCQLVITDLINKAKVKNLAIEVLLVEGLVNKLADFAKWFYNDPSKQLKLVGITGTNGKTSVAHYTAKLLENQYKVAVLGTLGNGVLGQLIATENTTLETVSLNRVLAEFVKQKVEVVVMEVSSHAIALGRIKGLNFTVLALTQVTRDHLDFHGTIEAYHQVKKSLFLDYPADSWVINSADKMGKSLLARTDFEQIEKVSYGKQKEDTLSVNNILLNQAGIQFKVVFQGTKINFVLKLYGKFNVENILCALGICLALVEQDKLTWLQKITTSLDKLKAISGRMELVNKLPQVIVDYAHTPEALQAVLQAVKDHINKPNQKLWLVFGCGGDRDKGKRPLMAKVAAEYANIAIVTDDNPRFESPQEIVKDILVGFNNLNDTFSFKVIHNRADAIAYALKKANKNDLIIVAGKGHEPYQDIAGVKTPMLDTELIQRAIKL